MFLFIPNNPIQVVSKKEAAGAEKAKFVYCEKMEEKKEYKKAKAARIKKKAAVTSHHAVASPRKRFAPALLRLNSNIFNSANESSADQAQVCRKSIKNIK